jgi:hypothetical protein
MLYAIKIWFIVCLKQNITSDFVSACFNCVALYVNENTVEKKVWFSN